jgi:hypothetical protein
VDNLGYPGGGVPGQPGDLLDADAPVAHQAAWVAYKWMVLRGGLPDWLDAIAGGRASKFRSGIQNSVAGMCRGCQRLWGRRGLVSGEEVVHDLGAGGDDGA